MYFCPKDAAVGQDDTKNYQQGAQKMKNNIGVNVSLKANNKGTLSHVT